MGVEWFGCLMLGHFFSHEHCIAILHREGVRRRDDSFLVLRKTRMYFRDCCLLFWHWEQVSIIGLFLDLTLADDARLVIFFCRIR
jgi:hypothetical protein